MNLLASWESTGAYSDPLQITLTYLNMSIVHLRKLPPNGKRALESALDALKLEPDNTKAKFREAQARIQCGETNKGKKMLEELYKVRFTSYSTSKP